MNSVQQLSDFKKSTGGNENLHKTVFPLKSLRLKSMWRYVYQATRVKELWLSWYFILLLQTPDAFSEIVLLAHRLAKCIGESSAEKQDFAIS